MELPALDQADNEITTVHRVSHSRSFRRCVHHLPDLVQTRLQHRRILLRFLLLILLLDCIEFLPLHTHL